MSAEITWLFDGCERAEAEAAETAAVAAVADADQQIDQLASAMADASGFTFRPATTRYGPRVRHLGGRGHKWCVLPSAQEWAFGGVPGVATVTSMGHVEWALTRLLSDKRIARATHNMLAYR